MTLVVGVAIQRGGRVLAARRTGGGWEFPGGKVEPGETGEAAAVREIAEELGCGIEVTGWCELEVAIRRGLVLRVARARLTAGEPLPRAGEHEAIRWFSPAELPEVDWLPADRPFLAVLGTL